MKKYLWVVVMGIIVSQASQADLVATTDSNGVSKCSFKCNYGMHKGETNLTYQANTGANISEVGTEACIFYAKKVCGTDTWEF